MKQVSTADVAKEFDAMRAALPPQSQELLGVVKQIIDGARAFAPPTQDDYGLYLVVLPEIDAMSSIGKFGVFMIVACCEGVNLDGLKTATHLLGWAPEIRDGLARMQRKRESQGTKH